MSTPVLVIYLVKKSIIIIIIGQPLCPVVGQRPQHAAMAIIFGILTSPKK